MVAGVQPGRRLDIKLVQVGELGRESEEPPYYNQLVHSTGGGYQPLPSTLEEALKRVSIRIRAPSGDLCELGDDAVRAASLATHSGRGFSAMSGCRPPIRTPPQLKQILRKHPMKNARGGKCGSDPPSNPVHSDCPGLLPPYPEVKHGPPASSLEPLRQPHGGGDGFQKIPRARHDPIELDGGGQRPSGSRPGPSSAGLYVSICIYILSYLYSGMMINTSC